MPRKSHVLPKQSKLLQLKGPGSMPKPSKKSTILTKKIRPSLSKKTFLEGLSILDNRNRERNPVEYSRRQLGLDTMDALFSLPKDVGNTISRYRSLQYFDAIRTDNISKFNELIQHRVDTNIVNREGDTPLIFLLKNRYANEMRYEFSDLLALSIENIDIQNNDGETALIWACYNCNEDYIQAILEVGANPDISDDSGFTALDIIRQDCDDYSELIFNALYTRKRLKVRKMLALSSALSDRLGRDSVFGDLDPETFRIISTYYDT